MTPVDLFLVAVVALSGFVGAVRGLIKEAFSLGTWVVSVWVALTFSERLAPVFAAKIPAPTVRVLLAGIVLFTGAMIIGGLLNYLFSQLVRKTGLTGTDRSLGFVFGLARGVIILALLFVVAVNTLPVEEENWWQESAVIPHVEKTVGWLRALLPDELAGYLPGTDDQPVADPAES